MKNWIVIILLFCCAIASLFISKINDKNLQNTWEEKNNTNPITRNIYSKIDSIGSFGRETFFKLSDGSMFCLYILNPPNKKLYYFFDKIDSGDTLISTKYTKQFLVIKSNNDTIRFEVKNSISDYEHVKK